MPELTQSLRKLWADSDQFFALIAIAFGPAFDKTSGCKPNRFSLLHLFHKFKFQIQNKTPKKTQREIPRERGEYVRDENVDDIRRTRSGGAKLAEDENDEIIRQVVEEIWFLSECGRRSLLFPEHDGFVFLFVSKRVVYM